MDPLVELRKWLEEWKKKRSAWFGIDGAELKSIEGWIQGAKEEDLQRYATRAY